MLSKSRRWTAPFVVTVVAAALPACSQKNPTPTMSPPPVASATSAAVVTTPPPTTPPPPSQLPPAPTVGNIKHNDDGTCMWSPVRLPMRRGMNPPAPHLVQCPPDVPDAGDGGDDGAASEVTP